MAKRRLPTVQVRMIGNESRVYRINQEDFDRATHVLADEAIQASGETIDETDETGQVLEEVKTVEVPRPLRSPEDWSGSNVEACVKALAQVSERGQLETIREAENSGRKRKTVLDALDKKLAAFRPQVDPTLDPVLVPVGG